MRRPAVSVLLVLVLVMAGACAVAEPAPTQVLAADPLAAALTDLVSENPTVPNTVQLAFGGSAELLGRLRNGEAAAVLATDEASMRKAVDAGLTAGDPVPFAEDRLVIVTAPGNPAGIGGLAGLGAAGTRVALGTPDSPLGRETFAAFNAAAVAEPAGADRVPTAAEAVDKVANGEADAAVAYASAALDASDATASVEIPPEANVGTTYMIAPLNASQAAVGFVTLVTSQTGRSVLERHGFDLP